MKFGIVLVLGIGIAQQCLSSIVLGIVLVCRTWYSPSLPRGQQEATRRSLTRSVRMTDLSIQLQSKLTRKLSRLWRQRWIGRLPRMWMIQGIAGFKIIIFIFTFIFCLVKKIQFVCRKSFLPFSFVRGPVLDSRSGTNELCLLFVHSLFQRR